MLVSLSVKTKAFQGKQRLGASKRKNLQKKKKFIQYKKQLGDEPKPAGGKMWVVLMGNLGHLYVLLHVTLRDRVMPGWSVSCWL